MKEAKPGIEFSFYSANLPQIYWKISLSGNDLETDTHTVSSAAETRMVLWSVSTSCISSNTPIKEEKGNIWHVQEQDIQPYCFNPVPSFGPKSRCGYRRYTQLQQKDKVH